MRALRRLALRILALGVLLGLVVGVVLAIVSHFSPNRQGKPTPATPPAVVPTAPVGSALPPSPSASTGQRVAGIARGCLGGQIASQAALTAQKEAALTPEGAAEFAATMMRWASEIPFPEASKAQINQLLAPNAPEQSRRVGQWPDSYAGATGYASFLQGRWYVDAFTREAATVSVSYAMVVDQPQEGTKAVTGAHQIRLRAIDGHWTFVDASPNHTPEQLGSMGTPYSGGC